MTEDAASPPGSLNGAGPLVAWEPVGGVGDRRCRSCGQPLGYWATDKLTGLLDRWGWDERATDAFSRARQQDQPVSLVIVDLDHFKQVNDRFGHVAGDAVLRQAAVVLRKETGTNDVLGRYGGRGGDEFLALLPEASLSDAVAVAHRVRTGIRGMRISTPGREGTTEIAGCTASIGVAAQAADTAVKLLDVLMAADTALRDAKLNGRDQVRAAGSPPGSTAGDARRRPDYDHLEEIETLVRYPWDAAALFCLEQQALRYTELGRQMTAWSGRHLRETDLTRTRHRLVRLKLIEAQPNASGNNVYSITDAGRTRLAQLRALVRTARTETEA